MKQRKDLIYELVTRYCSKSIQEVNKQIEKDGYEYCGLDSILTLLSRIDGRSDFYDQLMTLIPDYLDKKKNLNKFKKDLDKLFIPNLKDVVLANVHEVTLMESINQYKEATNYEDNWLNPNI